VWIYRIEQSSGGTCDNDYTFAYKPAVLFKIFIFHSYKKYL